LGIGYKRKEYYTKESGKEGQSKKKERENEYREESW
jgi:hypothetical protein